MSEAPLDQLHSRAIDSDNSSRRAGRGGSQGRFSGRGRSAGRGHNHRPSTAQHDVDVARIADQQQAGRSAQTPQEAGLDNRATHEAASRASRHSRGRGGRGQPSQANAQAPGANPQRQPRQRGRGQPRQRAAAQQNQRSAAASVDLLLPQTPVQQLPKALASHLHPLPAAPDCVVCCEPIQVTTMSLTLLSKHCEQSTASLSQQHVLTPLRIHFSCIDAQHTLTTKQANM